MKNKNSINLSKFLSRYENLCGSELRKISHEEVKYLFPNIKRSSFDEIRKNPELVYSGKVIMVCDGRTTIPYYVPQLEETKAEVMEFNREEVEPRQIDDKIYNYTSMSIYELSCLLSRKFNSARNQSAARRELDKRGALIKKKYDRNKFKKYKNEEE